MLKEIRKPEDMIWYYWECVHTEALTAKHIGAITEEECAKYDTLTSNVVNGKRFTLELRTEACQLEFDLEKHREALDKYYTERQEEFMNS